LYNVMSTILIEVRRAKPSDATAIAATHDEAWRGAYQGIIPGPELDKAHQPARPAMVGQRGSQGSRIAVLAFGDNLPATPITAATARAASTTMVRSTSSICDLNFRASASAASCSRRRDGT
jgi:hypothetical protein